MEVRYLLEDDGVPALVRRLCQIHAGPVPKAHFLQPALTYNQKLKKVKNAAYDSLFCCLSGPHRNLTFKSSAYLNEEQACYSHAFGLRVQRKFDEANKLEKLVESFLAGDNALLEEKKAVLHLLLSLADTSPIQEKKVVGHTDVKLPVVFSQNCTGILPDGPQLYGDSCYQKKDSLLFMHYPKDIFEGEGLKVDKMGDVMQLSIQQKLFEAKPGTGLCGKGFFSHVSSHNDYEEKNHLTLFGALVHSHCSELDFTLNIPEISPEDDSGVWEPKVPQVYESSDEGFAETVSSDSDIDVIHHEEEPDIWEQALNFVPSKHYVWERIGKPPDITERHYITEAGKQVFDQLTIIRLQHLKLLDPSLNIPIRREISMRQLMKDAINLLIAVPSDTFTLVQDSGRFEISDGTCISGLSAESVAAVCQPLVTCGTHYCHLTRCVEPVIINSFYQRGLIFQAFTEGVRRYLHHYRACVLSIPTSKTILQLSALTHKIVEQLRFLSELCMCSSDDGKSSGSGSFPTGLDLLSYLYNQALDATSSHNYAMVLSLLHTACGPYMIFVQDWVFYGVCHDSYGEFMIRVNDEYLRFRDKHYWNQGYVKASEDPEKCVPHFLQDLANDIYICGKTINLLKICSPEHFLFSVDMSVPRVMITYSEQALMSIGHTCQAYISRMQEIARQNTLSIHEARRRADQAKQDLIAFASRAAVRQIRRIQDKILETKKREDVKKRKLFSELKEQMEKDKERRASKKSEEKSEDRARVEAATKQELLEAEVEEDVEQKARENLIEYYSHLSVEAAARERRALWLAQRRELHVKRRQFLDDEEKILTEELEQLAFPENVIIEEPIIAEEELAGVLSSDVAVSLALQSQDGESESQTDGRKWQRTDVGSADIPMWARGVTSTVDSAAVVPDEAPDGSTVDVKGMDHMATSEHPLVGTAQGPVDDAPINQPAEGEKSHSEDQALSTADTPPINQPPESSQSAPQSAESLQSTPRTAQQFGSDFMSIPEPVGKYKMKATVKIGENTASNMSGEIVRSEIIYPKDQFGLEMMTLPDAVGRSKMSNVIKIGESTVESNEPVREIIRPEDALSLDLMSLPEPVDRTRIGLSQRPVQMILDKTESVPYLHHPSDSTIGGLMYDGEGGRKVDGQAIVTVTGDNKVESVTEVPPQTKQSPYIETRPLVGERVTQPPETGDDAETEGVSASPTSEDVSAALIKKVTKRHIKSVDDRHISKQSEEDGDDRPSIKVHHEVHTAMSEGAVDKPAIRLVQGQSIAQETSQHDTEHSSVQFVKGRNINEESEQDPVTRSPIKRVHDIHANMESESCVDLQTGHLKTQPNIHANLETQQAIPHVKPVNIHGHASEESHEVLNQVPRKKQIRDMSVGKESTETHEIRPHGRRKIAGQFAERESDHEEVYRPHIKMNKDMNVNKMSEEQDTAELNRIKFQQQNIHGHSSNSTIQRLLYGRRNEESLDKTQLPDQDEESVESELRFEDDLQPYPDDFSLLDSFPMPDLLASLGEHPANSLTDYSLSSRVDVEAHDLFNLPSLLKRSVTAPLLAQICLVNQSVIDYFMVELRIERHFSILRSLLLMEDGEFGQSLSDQLFEKLSLNPRPQDMLNPMFLNSVLNRALRCSMSGESDLAQNISFSLKYLPTMLERNAPDALDCLDLTYKVSWPLNIIITDGALAKYSRVFSFMLQLKHAVWVLKDIFHKLKRDSIITDGGDSVQIRQLQLFRHEMQHFVKVMQGYVANQVIHTSWQEFQEGLTGHIHNLDDLYTKHAQYLNKCLFRCLLNKKAGPVMEIIQVIFGLILRLHSQLVSQSWETNPATGVTQHPAFNDMCNTYTSFNHYSKFLFKVVTKLTLRGYQPHLKDFILRLNFNTYYNSSI